MDMDYHARLELRRNPSERNEPGHKPIGDRSIRAKEQKGSYNLSWNF